MFFFVKCAFVHGVTKEYALLFKIKHKYSTIVADVHDGERLGSAFGVGIHDVLKIKGLLETMALPVLS